MPYPVNFSYHFFPVGQGLFATGALQIHRRYHPDFVWVYDCGTSSADSCLTQSIDDFEQHVGDRKRIDILTLSHFDQDHISGVVDLLAKFEVGILLLPYMTFDQRIVKAFEEGQGGSQDPLNTFFIDPVAYFNSIDGPGIEQIVFVPPSSGEGPPISDGGSDLGSPSGSNFDFDVSFDKLELDELGDRDVFEDGDDYVERQRWCGDTTQDGGGNVAFLRKRSRLTVARGLWEFVPYNSDTDISISQEFRDLVNQHRNALLQAVDSEHRQQALDAIEVEYERLFGSKGKSRNIISLFLYGGPTLPLQGPGYYLRMEQRWRIRQANQIPDRPIHPFRRTWLHDALQCSVLYTGDGYLDNADRLNSLFDYLNVRRLTRVGIFQVMHHGAKTNWHKGVADAIAPIASVFCSNPEANNGRHPNQEVLRDFWLYGALQVDMYTDFTVIYEIM